MSRIIVDPHFRRIHEVFSADDLRALNSLGEVVWARDTPMPRAAFEEALEDAVCVVCADWRYGDVLPAATQLRAILTISGAFPLDLDYDYCFRRGIRVLSAAPAFARQVAEMSLAMALTASREIVEGDTAMRSCEERYTHDGNEHTFMLYGRSVGFVGYGSIARELQRLLSPFKPQISVFDPWLSDRSLLAHGVTPVSLETLMSRSKVIFVLAAPTRENKAMLSRELLESIAPGSLLVLMSRAHVVDFDAMTELADQGRFTAAVDVFPTEPVPDDHPIRSARNTVLSAHRAGSVREGLLEIGRMVVDDLDMILRGLPPRMMQSAEPELVSRLTVNRAASPEKSRG